VRRRTRSDSAFRDRRSNPPDVSKTTGQNVTWGLADTQRDALRIFSSNRLAAARPTRCSIDRIPPPPGKHPLACRINNRHIEDKLLAQRRNRNNQITNIVKPLTRLCSSKTTWRWEDEEMKAFETIKIGMARAPHLAFPQEGRELR